MQNYVNQCNNISYHIEVHSPALETTTDVASNYSKQSYAGSGNDANITTTTNAKQH